MSEETEKPRGAAARERDRVQRAYSRYAGSTRKRRAWAADNPGNAAIRGELLDQVMALAGDEIAAPASPR